VLLRHIDFALAREDGAPLFAGLRPHYQAQLEEYAAIFSGT